MALSTGNAMTKIALVEDNPDNRMLVHAILDDVFDIVDYENGVDALAGITANRPDVVLLDISLPQMDGTEVLRRIRADSELSDLPVVALTAHAMAGDREKYWGLGFDDYVTKPILDEAVLVAAIAELLKRHGG
jgi:two-component system, cell cycle response regulator DivK